MTQPPIFEVPDAPGKVFVVTGGHAGIGYFVSEQLALDGARVVLASRSAQKAQQAMQAIRARVPGAELDYLELDLSSLTQVKAAGQEIAALERVDGLILNAASLTQKERRHTPDGHELVFGTNFFGNVQLIAETLPALQRTPASRVVTMGSMAYRIARLHLDDLERSADSYRGFRTYATAKLAQMIFALELDRRLRAAASSTISVIAHPGGALDGLTPDRPPAFTVDPGTRRKARIQRAFVQGKDRAAWPVVQASIGAHVEGGRLWGPGSATGSKPPKLERLRGSLNNRETARALWDQATRELDLHWEI
jgi:NAD(P)-dependent dehydrogenase (short-subunit alcohol dehydrogenase family)